MTLGESTKWQRSRGKEVGTTLSRGWTPPSQRLEPSPVKTNVLPTTLLGGGDRPSEASILSQLVFSTRESSWQNPGSCRVG